MTNNFGNWKHKLITGIAGFIFFEIVVFWTQLHGGYGQAASDALSIILLPVQIGSIVMLGLNLILILYSTPYFQRRARLEERTKQFIAILIPVVQLLIILSMLLLSNKGFCQMVSTSSDMYIYVLDYSWRAFILLLPTTVITAAISYPLQKASLLLSALAVVVIGIVGFIFSNLATGMFGMPQLGGAMIVAIQPFAFLMSALRIDMLIPKSKRTEGRHMNAESSMDVTEKSKLVSALLAFFIGGVGAHRYYLGYNKVGAIQTCGFVGLILGCLFGTAAIFEGGILALFVLALLLFGLTTEIWSFIDFIRILIGSLIPANGTLYAESSPKQVRVINSAPSATDNADALEKLAALHKQGVLTDEEFQKKKADILERM